MWKKMVFYCSLFCIFLAGCEDIFPKENTNGQFMPTTPDISQKK